MSDDFFFASFQETSPQEVKPGVTARIVEESFGRDEHRRPETLIIEDGVFGDGEREHEAGSVITGAPGSAHHPQSKAGCTVPAIHPEGL
jgi:hypothetical protein